jgi:signal transduction histidine kinase
VAILDAKGKPDPQSRALSPAHLSTAISGLAEHQQNHLGQLQVSEPVMDEQTGNWALQLSRGIRAGDGRFLGVAIVQFELTDLAPYFSSLHFMKDSESLLLRADGRVLLRTLDTGPQYPVGVDRGSRFSGSTSGKLKDGTGALVAGTDGVDRYYVMRPVGKYPLMVAKGIAMSTIIQVAQPVLKLIAGLGILVCLMMALALIWLHMYVKQTHINLTERLRAEEELRENEERLNWALVGSESAEWQIHVPGERLFLSKRLAHTLGYADGDRYMEPAEWQSFVHPADMEKMRALMPPSQQAEDEGTPQILRLRKETGDFLWLAVRGRVSERNQQGQAIRVTGLARDVTEQYKSRARVEDRSAQLDAIFRLSPDGYVTFDAMHQVKYVNPAFVAMTGCNFNDIKGMSLKKFSDFLAALCTDQRPFVGLAALFSEAWGTQNIPSTLIELKGEPRRIVRVSLKISSAPSVSQILYFRDVTHETLVEAMKTEFLATAAHELRTPMASIVGFSEILCTHSLTPDEQMEFARIISRQSVHLSGILDELLDLSRIESRAGLGFVFEEVDLGLELDEVVRGLVLPAGRAGPVWQLPPLTCWADRGKVRQVIGNVLSNAHKFSSADRPVTIKKAVPALHPTSGQKLVGIEISDAGIGMNSETLGRVYERFYRADKSGSIPGSGLGLSITKEIMGLLGGQIQIESEYGQGTRVTMLFPRSAKHYPELSTEIDGESSA